MFELSVQSSFAAAHRLRSYQGKCEALHGHNWKVVITVQAEALNDIGLAIDFHELKALLGRALQPLDHACLNDIPPFTELNPSSENIARFLFGFLSRELQQTPVTLKKVAVWESETSCAAYFE